MTFANIEIKVDSSVESIGVSWMNKWSFLSLATIIDCMLLTCHVHVSKWIYTLYLPECQGAPCSKQAQY